MLPPPHAAGMHRQSETFIAWLANLVAFLAGIVLVLLVRPARPDFPVGIAVTAAAACLCLGLGLAYVSLLRARDRDAERLRDEYARLGSRASALEDELFPGPALTSESGNTEKAQGIAKGAGLFPEGFRSHDL